MERSLRWRIPIIVAVVGLSVLAVGLNWPPPLGIDIKGGVSLVYEVDPNEIKDETQRSGLVERTTGVVRKRLDPEGVRELTIRALGQNQFEVQMPKPRGGRDEDVTALLEEAKRRITRLGKLEFRLLADEELERQAKAEGRVPEGCKWYPVAPNAQKGLENRTEVLVRVDDTFDLTGSSLRAVGRGVDQNGLNAVSFSFNDVGSKKFGWLTGQNIDKRLAIILDGKIQSAPVIQSRIERHGIITGGSDGFSRKEQDELITILNAGSLEVTPKLVGEQVVGAQVGQENIQKGIRAAVWAATLVVVFMAVYYLFAGVVADLALALNLLLVLAVMTLIGSARAGAGVTLTLPGIAGLVLTLGMAVDANVLIFERIREERQTHLALPLAVQNGYKRAFVTIVDSNLTTIIAAVTLVFFGTEAVRGFGITLTLGLLASMFTQLFVTRAVFDGLATSGVLKGLKMLQLIKKPAIDFLKVRWLAVGVSVGVIVVGMFLFFRRPLSENLGTDFTGGTRLEFTLNAPMALTEVNRRLAAAGYPQASIQTVYRAGEEFLPASQGRSFLVTVRDPDRDTVGERVYEVFKAELPPKSIECRVAGVPLPLAGPTDTGDRRTFGGGLRSTVTLGRPLAPADIRRRIDRAVEEAKAAGRDLGPCRADFPPSTAEATAEFTFLSLEADQNKVEEFLTRAFVSSPFTGVSNFSAKVAAGLARDALVAIAVALALILVYVRFRFGRWSYGLGGLVALVHDALVTVSFLSIASALAPTAIGRALMFQDFRIDLVMVAALLTIIGYSINDTIVIFDRIRENLGGRKDRRVTAGVVNDSVNQTLTRTIWTAFTTLVVVVVLYIFGGEGVHGFAFAMIVGVVTGTYSSVYIAPPFLLGWTMPEPAAAKGAQVKTQEKKD